MAWNINAVKTKLEKSLVQKFLLECDIISLSETKTQLNVSLPGFVTFRRVNSVSSHRGVVVMVKNYLANHVTNIDYSTNDQIWLKLRCVPNVIFAFVIFRHMILSILRSSRLQLFKRESVMVTVST